MTTIQATTRRAAPTTAPRVAEVAICDIEPHPGNIRRQGLGELEELAASIRQKGVLQPLLVVEHPSRSGGYRLLAGHRRHAAAQLAGRATVPVVVHPEPVGTAVAIEVMLIENCHRVDLSAVEKAEAFGQRASWG